jgi:hypothetical protein
MITMPETAVYRVVRRNDEWAIEHDNKVEGTYATKEAAFEAIIGAASNSIKGGVGVSIEIPPRRAGQSSLGAA